MGPSRPTPHGRWRAQQRVSASDRYFESLHPHPSHTPAGDAS
ncbi:MAG TPA: hypothetical protein VLK79_14520 [Gaiellales bacterium]|nr:hypothetical protein [Gaiellales bacterium]